ncbi:MAG: type II toxin-antitoxin system VapC family toxin [Thiolinea sp.]
MIGLDTNMLVRYIVQDDAEQAASANRVIDALNLEHKAVISKIVLCELSWVLAYSYRYQREQIAMVLDTLLTTQEFVVEDSGQALRALQHYQSGSAGFADYFLALSHQALGAEYTVSLDKKACASPLFRSPAVSAQ